jgi:hypothetical protein
MKNNELVESLKPTLIEVEQFRKKQLEKKQLEYGFYAMGTILFLLLILSWGVYGFVLTGGIFAAFVILVVLRLSMVGTPKKDYQEEYSNQVTKALVQKLNPSIKYSSNNHKYQASIRNSGLFGGANFSKSTGVLLNGKTKNGYPFQLMEVSLVGREVVTSNRTQVTYYKGMVCVIEGEHYLGEHTIIKPKTGWTESSMSILTKVGKKVQFTLFSTKHKLASFNEKYTVYTKRRNEVEALLTKDALQKMAALMGAQKTPVDMVFQENKLFLFLSGVNHFEINIKQKLLETNAVSRSYNKIKSSLNLVEELSALIGGERMEIIIKEEIKPLDNATDSAYDHFIEDEL